MPSKTKIIANYYMAAILKDDIIKKEPKIEKMVWHIDYNCRQGSEVYLCQVSCLYHKMNDLAKICCYALGIKDTKNDHVVVTLSISFLLSQIFSER